ncbi:MAG: hypothetical protein D6806_16030 [Deltaproteobacteria bacterium]|nr:MAG: hypothetical protein D6806_16030 [Deltaproteobacteria bacterium]
MEERHNGRSQRVEGQDWAVIDLVRRALVAGMGALFMTEEGIRSFLGELKLPKDAVNFLLNQVGKTKQDLFRALGVELRNFMEGIDWSERIRQLLASMDVKIEMHVSFEPRPQKRASASKKKKQK